MKKRLPMTCRTSSLFAWWFLACGLGIVLKSAGQVVRYDDKRQRLFYCMSNSAPQFGEVLKRAGLRNCIYFSGRDIDPEQTGTLNKAALKVSVDRLVPDTAFAGILVLDWEDSLYNRLKFGGNIDDKGFDAAVDEFIRVLRYAKTLRPRAQWAYWDIPMSIFWVDVDTLWRRRIDRISPLLKEVDILMPHLYDYFPTGVRSGREDTAYIVQILTKTLEMAVKFQKPVLPFIWHRYSDAIPETGLKKMDEKEFLQQLRLMRSVTYKRKKINGVIWWQEDLYFLNISAPNITKEMEGIERDKYRDDVLLKYWSLARQVFLDE